jgi:hypothetical protein
MNEKEKNNKKYTVSDIERYLQGNLSSDEMHAMERAALEDPFLADAIEGIQQSLQKTKAASFDQDILELRRRLKDRVGSKRKAIPLWTRAAAAVFILTIGASLAYYFIQKNTTKESTTALKREKNIAQPADSSMNPSATSPAVKSDTIISESENFKKAPPETGQEDLAKAIRRKNDRIKVKKDTSSPVTGLASSEQVIAAKDEAPKASPTAADKEKINEKKSSDYLSVQRNSNSFEGKVIDQNNRPIASASVELKDKNVSAVTDNNGNFKLSIKDPDSVMYAKISSIGYQPASIALNNNGSTDIVLKREIRSNLQEMVSAPRARNIAGGNQINQDAEPVKGWDDYNKYLETNRKIPQDSLGMKGIVVISFIVKKNGRPSDLSVDQSLGPDYDAEAIRLIKEGPAWKLLKGKKATVKVNVRF